MPAVFLVAFYTFTFLEVPAAGLEPTLQRKGLLRPPRLPFRQAGKLSIKIYLFI